MLVVADKAFFDAEMVQQLQGYAGILRRDKVRIFQCFTAALGNVTQITDGGRNEILHSGHNLISYI